MENTENIRCLAQRISDYLLKYCIFNDVTSSSGCFVIKEFPNGTERTVDVYKSTNGGYPHYVVYCLYEDENIDFGYSEDLTVDSLVKVLKEFYEEE